MQPAPDTGWDTFVVRLPAAHVPDSPFITGGGAEDLSLTVHLNLQLRPWITELRQRA